MLLTALLPYGSTEEDLKEIVDGAYKAAGEIGIEILGGHTEITEAVNKPVVNGTVIENLFLQAALKRDSI